MKKIVIVRAYFNFQTMTDVVFYYKPGSVQELFSTYSDFVRLYGHEYDQDIIAVYER